MNISLNKPQHITSLATAGLLVSVEVNVWSATKQDRAISNEVTLAKKADQNAGRFVKNLLANNVDHKNLLNYRQTIYNWMVRTTYPWNKAQDFLPHVSLPKFMQEFHNHQAEFNKLLDTFCNNYATTVSNRRSHKAICSTATTILTCPRCVASLAFSYTQARFRSATIAARLLRTWLMT